MHHEDHTHSRPSSISSRERADASTHAIHARPTHRRRRELGLTDEDIVRQLESGVGPAGRSIEPRR